MIKHFDKVEKVLLDEPNSNTVPVSEDKFHLLPLKENIEKSWVESEKRYIREQLELLDDAPYGESRGKSTHVEWRKYRVLVNNYMNVLDGNRPVRPE